MGKRFKFGLISQLLLLLVIALSAPLILLPLYIVPKETAELKMSAEESIDRKLQILSMGMSEALWAYSADSVKPMVEELLKDPLVTKIIVRDDKGTELVSLSDTGLTTPDEFSKNRAVLKGDRKIGDVVVEYNFNSLNSSRIRMIKNYFAFALLGLSISGVLLFLMIGKVVLLRVQRLEGEARQMASGSLDSPFVWQGSDEISSLGISLEESRKTLSRLLSELNHKNFELMRANSELEDRINQKTQQVVQAAKMASLGEMAGGVAHEINNPLAIIQLRVNQMIQKIDKGAYDQEFFKKSLDGIRDTTDRVAKIVKGMRTFSRSGESDPFQATKVLSILEDTLALCAEKMKVHGIEIQTHLDPEITLECRPVQISQVLLNLISNAKDAVENLPEKWIRIDFENQQDVLRISVTDSGHGLNQDVAAKIMQPFFTTKSVGKGTGLGLSISRGIVESHSGKLWLNEKSAHTQFVIEIPHKLVKMRSIG